MNMQITSKRDILCDTYCSTQPNLKPQAGEASWGLMFFHTSDEHFKNCFLLCMRNGAVRNGYTV